MFSIYVSYYVYYFYYTMNETDVGRKAEARNHMTSETDKDTERKAARINSSLLGD